MLHKQIFNNIKILKTMKLVFPVFFYLLTFGFLCEALAASGFEVVGYYNGDSCAILIYYDDSVAWMAEDVNADLPGFLREMGFDVYYSRPVSEEEILEIALEVMDYGSESKGWRYCIGIVFYSHEGFYFLDEYLLGYENSPYTFLGRFSLNSIFKGSL